MLPPCKSQNSKDTSIIRYDIEQDSYSKLTEYPSIPKRKEATRVGQFLCLLLIKIMENYIYFMQSRL